MARQARMQGRTGIYHAMVRGINKRNIFLDDLDRLEFLDILRRMNTEGEYSLYGYCLMGNHIHLLIREEADPLHRTMKRIGVSYSYYFNKRHERVGHLFQGRFKSETIDTEASLLNCLRYIHNNPVKAHIVWKLEDYRWSSYNTYIGNVEDTIVDTDFILGSFSENKNVAINRFMKFTAENLDESFLDIEEDQVVAIDPLEIIKNVLDKYNLRLEDLKDCKDKKLRNQIIAEIKNNSNSSMRQLSDMMGLDKNMIYRAAKKNETQG